MKMDIELFKVQGVFTYSNDNPDSCISMIPFGNILSVTVESSEENRNEVKRILVDLVGEAGIYCIENDADIERFLDEYRLYNHNMI